MTSCIEQKIKENDKISFIGQLSYSVYHACLEFLLFVICVKQYFKLAYALKNISSFYSIIVVLNPE